MMAVCLVEKCEAKPHRLLTFSCGEVLSVCRSHRGEAQSVLTDNGKYRTCLGDHSNGKRDVHPPRASVVVSDFTVAGT